ncbi:MAG: hypothetical protein WCK89_20200 [bacterium]
MKHSSTIFIAFCSLFFASCLPVQPVDNALWDEIARDHATIVLAKMDVANGKLSHHFVSFIKNGKNLSVESAQNGLVLHDLPSEERIAGKQAVVLFDDSDRVTRILYVYDADGQIPLSKGRVELKHILRDHNP